MSVRLVCAILLLAASTALAGKKDALAASNAKSLGLVGKTAPEFTLPDLKQQTFRLADRRGAVVVLVFWATWCPPCRSEMPMVARLQKELEPEGVVIAPVALDNPVKTGNFLRKKNLEVWSLVDEPHAVGALYGAGFIPKSFVIGRDGRVFKAYLDELSEQEVRRAIQDALSGR